MSNTTDVAKQLTVRNLILADSTLAGETVLIDDGRESADGGALPAEALWSPQAVETALGSRGLCLIVQPFGTTVIDEQVRGVSLATRHFGRVAVIDVPAINDAEGGAGLRHDEVTAILKKVFLAATATELPDGSELIEPAEEDGGAIIRYFNFDYRETMRV